MERRYPDYDIAYNTALNTIRRYRLHTLPIQLEKAIEQIKCIRLLPYTGFCRMRKISLDEAIEHLGSKLGVITKDPEKERYIIYYNDTLNNPGLDRFTIAHELGHYLLGHMRFAKIMLRKWLTDEEYDDFEKETNSFARNLLSPAPLIPLMGIKHQREIEDVFSISWDAARARLGIFQWDRWKITKEHTAYFAKVFFDSIYGYKNKRYCATCGHTFIAPSNEVFCPMCSSCGIKPQSSQNFMEVEMQYDEGVQVNENGRACICPRCDNEDISGDYCKICGVCLTNTCSGDRDDRNDDLACGTNASSNARYCVNCGARTVFYNLGVLKSWEEEKAKKEGHPLEWDSTINERDDVPF